MPQVRGLLGVDSKYGTFEDILQKMGVKRGTMGSHIIEFGDLGHEFFIIMEGTVSI